MIKILNNFSDKKQSTFLSYYFNKRNCIQLLKVKTLYQAYFWQMKFVLFVMLRNIAFYFLKLGKKMINKICGHSTRII
jgi:hypothetical protein